jgi:hypothetical protein
VDDEERSDDKNDGVELKTQRDILFEIGRRL